MNIVVSAMRQNISDVKDIGNIIEARRAKLHLSQSDMLLKAGMSQQQVQRIEAGANITVKTLLHLADVLGLEITVSPKGENAISSGPAPVYEVKTTKKRRKADQNLATDFANTDKVTSVHRRGNGAGRSGYGKKKESPAMKLYGHLLDKDDE